MTQARQPERARAEIPAILDADALSGLFGALHEFVLTVILDSDWNITHANDLFADRFDPGDNGLVGRNCAEFQCNTADDSVWEQIQAKITGGETWQGELSLQTDEGEPVCLRALIHPVTKEGGKLHQVVALLRDISREKGIETEFKRSQILNEEAAEVARLGAWECDLVNHTVYWSDETRKIHEVDENHVPDVESGIEFYKPGSSRKRIVAAIKAAIEDGTPFDKEFEIITAKGRELWVRSIGHAEHVDGQCVRIFGVFQDIDKEKRLRLNYESTSNFLETVLNAATEFSIIATDKEGLITLFNTGAEKLLGYRSEEMVNRQTPEIFHSASEVAERGAELSERFGRKIEGFEVFSAAAKEYGHEGREWTYVRKDGSHVPVVLVVTPRTDFQGEVVGYIGIARDISLRKKALKDLLASEERWHFALEGSGDGVWDWDARTDRVFYSRQWKAMIGYAESDIGDSLDEWKNRVHPEDLPQCLQDLDAHFNGRSSVYVNEHRMRCKDGSYKWILDRGKVIQWADDGKPARVIGTHTDITERRTFQQKIEESEHRFRSAFTDSAIGMAVVGLDGRWIEVNSSLCQILGYSEKELQGLTFQELTHKDDLEADLNLLRETLDGKRSSYMLYKRYWHASGRKVWARLTVTLVRDNEEEPVHFISQVEDLSANRELEATLMETKDRLALATRSSGIGIWDWNIKGNELIWDEQMYTLYAQEPQSFKPSYEHWHALLHPEDRERLATEIDAALEGRAEYDTEFRTVWPGGTVRHMRAVAAFVQNVEGSPARMVGTNWDITQSIEQKEELARLARSAEEASRAKSQFLANMSHEIRTPLNGIIGMADLIFDSDDLSEEHTEFIDVIRRSGTDLLSLVNDILDFSKIEAGRMDLDEQAFSLKKMLSEACGLFRNKAESRGLALSFQLDKDLPEQFTGDPLRIRQVLNNLISNAIKFTNAGRIEVSVEPIESRAPDARVCLRFSVKDTGIGIEPSVMDKMFQEFSQADSSTSRLYGGTGLGLAISKSLVELMGGEIGVDSEVGLGSDFWFKLTLPSVDAEPQEAQPKLKEKLTAPAPTTAPSRPGAYEEHSFRILFAEDNQTNQYLAAALFKDTGLQVDFVENGLEALDMLKHSTYDLVLMDVQMPQMDGNEATRKIRAGLAGEANRDIPILAVTAHTQPEDRQTCLNAGMNGYIPKPIKRTQMFELIDSFLLASSATKKSSVSAAVQTEVSDLTLFDRDSFVERVMGDTEIAHTVAERACKDLKRHLIGLKRALGEKDPKQLHFHAHAIKGVALLVECRQLAKLAEGIQTQPKDRLIQAVTTQMDEIQSHAKDALAALEDFLGAK